jgi:thymidine kinase
MQGRQGQQTTRPCGGGPNQMSKVYFYYSAMNAGKSTVLLQSSYNYKERGMRTLLFVPAHGHALRARGASSRGSASAPTPSRSGRPTTSSSGCGRAWGAPVACVLVDEAQFLTPAAGAPGHRHRGHAADPRPVLRPAHRLPGAPLPGQRRAARGRRQPDRAEDHLPLRPQGDDEPAGRRRRKGRDAVGAQVEIGGNDRYVAMCRRHFKEAFGPG